MRAGLVVSLLVVAGGCGPSVEPRLSDIEEKVFAGCATSGCHSAADREGELVLAPGQSWAALVGVPAKTEEAKEEGWLLVSPGSPEDSFLILKLQARVEPRFGVPMPWGGPALDEDVIAAIETWIRDGAKDD